MKGLAFRDSRLKITGMRSMRYQKVLRQRIAETPVLSVVESLGERGNDGHST